LRGFRDKFVIHTATYLRLRIYHTSAFDSFTLGGSIVAGFLGRGSVLVRVLSRNASIFNSGQFEVQVVVLCLEGVGLGNRYDSSSFAGGSVA
jgi:hypothetical protein